jgi:magnesium transporter
MEKSAIDPEAETPPVTQPDPLWALAWSERDGPRVLSTFDEVRAAHEDRSTRLWVDLTDADRELLLALGGVLAIHPLVMEDVLERNQRAKIELTGEALHLVMFALSYAGEIVADEVDIVVGQRFLLTSHEAAVNPRSAPFMRRDPTAHLAGGTDYLLWALSDWLVDDYFPVFDRLGDEIDELEDDVMRRPSSWIVERLFQIRRELLVVRHAVSPQREIFNQLTNRDLGLIKRERILYFRDVYDHLIRLTDELDSYRELVGTAMDIYLSQVNNNLNEVVKRLTAVTAVLAGAGALAGIFGMSEAGLAISFEDLRFWMVTIGIAFVSAIGIVYFRRIGWI